MLIATKTTSWVQTVIYSLISRAHLCPPLAQTPPSATATTFHQVGELSTGEITAGIKLISLHDIPLAAKEFSIMYL